MAESLPTLDDLLTIPTQQDVFDQEVIPALRGQGSRVTDWISGGVYRAAAFLISKLRLEDRKGLAAWVGASIGDYVFGFVSPPFGIDITSWAPAIARNIFGIDQFPATPTVRSIRLVNSVATPYGPLADGAIVLQFASGNRYVLHVPPDSSPVTIPASDEIFASFRSEFAADSTATPPRSYNTDQSNQDLLLVTASFPGVTASNPAPTYSSVSRTGYGLGTLTLSGTPIGQHTVAVRIDTDGQSGAATWSTSIDGGSWTSQGAASSVSNLGSLGVGIALTDDGDANPSFIHDDVYYFSWPGSDITQSGRDVETPQELGTRCRAVFPAIAFVKDADGNWVWQSPTRAAYELLAKLASSQVKVAIARLDPNVNNKVRIIVAGQGGPVPANVLATLQAFFNSRNMLTDRVGVEHAVARVVTLGGGVTITVRAGQLAAAQKQLQGRLQNYLGGVDPNNLLEINGLIDRAYLVGLIRTTIGVTRTNADTALTIDTDATSPVATNVQLPIVSGQFERAQWTGQNVTTAFTWLTSG